MIIIKTDNGTTGSKSRRESVGNKSPAELYWVTTSLIDHRYMCTRCSKSTIIRVLLVLLHGCSNECYTIEQQLSSGKLVIIFFATSSYCCLLGLYRCVCQL